MGEVEHSRRWGGASWPCRAILWLMDWLMQDAAKDLVNAEEDKMGEEQGGFRGGGPARTEGGAGAKAGGGAGGEVLGPGVGGCGKHAGTPADEEEHGGESLRAGLQAGGSRSLSCHGDDHVSSGQLGPDTLVLEAWRSGSLEVPERKIKTSRDKGGPAAPWGFLDEGLLRLRAARRFWTWANEPNVFQPSSSSSSSMWKQSDLSPAANLTSTYSSM